MRKLVSLALASAFIAGCTPQDIEEQIKKNLPQACSTLSLAHTVFLTVTMSGKVKQKTIDTELASYNGVQVFCADPGNVNASNALIKVAQAYVVVTLALTEAKKASNI